MLTLGYGVLTLRWRGGHFEVRKCSVLGTECSVWGTESLSLGYGIAQFGVRIRSESKVLSLGYIALSLGYGSAQFGVRNRSVWGTESLSFGYGVLSLGYGHAQFWVRNRSVLGTESLSFGYGIAQFRVREIFHKHFVNIYTETT